MKHRLAVVLCCAALTGGVAGSAAAGIVDSPLPDPFTKHVYSVPGVISYFDLRTFFACTNVDAGDVTVGVEIFPSTGLDAINDAAESAVTLSPGGTITFASSAPTPSFPNTVDLEVGNLIRNASARVVATSTKLICTAFVADGVNEPPVAGYALTIVSKTKQAGD
jgi:hypothetical protein